MTCREFLAALRGSAPAAGPEARRHAASCPSCAAEERAALLLRLGSERPEDAAPRAGFEARLRARLDDAARDDGSRNDAARDAAAAAAAGRDATTDAPPWTRELDPLVRPALALGAIVVALSIGLYARSAALQPDPADLASLFEADPVLSSLLGTPESR